MGQGMGRGMLHTSQPQAVRRQDSHEVADSPFDRAAAVYSHHQTFKSRLKASTRKGVFRHPRPTFRNQRPKTCIHDEFTGTFLRLTWLREQTVNVNVDQRPCNLRNDASLISSI